MLHEMNIAMAKSRRSNKSTDFEEESSRSRKKLGIVEDRNSGKKNEQDGKRSILRSRASDASVDSGRDSSLKRNEMMSPNTRPSDQFQLSSLRDKRNQTKEVIIVRRLRWIDNLLLEIGGCGR